MLLSETLWRWIVEHRDGQLVAERDDAGLTDAPFGSLHVHWHPTESDAALTAAIARVRTRLGLRATPETTDMAPGIATLPPDAPDAPDMRTDASPSPQGHTALLAPMPLPAIRTAARAMSAEERP